MHLTWEPSVGVIRAYAGESDPDIDLVDPERVRLTNRGRIGATITNLVYKF